MLLTSMIEAERIVNNRPIIPVSDDHTETLVLTPNNLLLLYDNGGIPTTEDLRTQYTKRWKRVTHLAHLFWNRWVKEYLPTLQARKKWLNATKNFQVGDIVLILSEPKQLGKWPLGRITACEMDADGLVRTVTVKRGD